MNQKIQKLSILLLVLFLTSFKLGFLNKFLQYDLVAEDIDNGSLTLETSSSGWDPEILVYLGGIGEAIDIFVGDANNDGYNDIVTANVDSNEISILLWNSITESWSAPILKTFGGLTYSITIGDANNDGYNDIVVGWIISPINLRISIFCWNFTIQNWNSRITKSVSADPIEIQVGDVNNDGFYDIITGGGGASNLFSYFIWNNAINDWNPHATHSFAALVYDIFLGDANNDGFNDVVGALFEIDEVNILIWNDTLKNWNPGITKSVGDSPEHIFLGDANNDGDNDIVVSNYFSDDISILVWNSTISDWNGEIRKNAGGSPSGIFIGDVNNDGYNDIVVANLFPVGEDDISLYLWNSTLNYWNVEMNLVTFYHPIELFVGDVDNDGLKDLASVFGSNFVSIYLSIIDTPVLNPISPNVDTNGIVKLNWSNVKGITHYYIYRNTSYINSIDGLDPIAVSSENNYTDTLSLNGDYYYVVIASDGFGNSSISNCRSVEVRIPLDTPTLAPIIPDPDYDGSIDLDWDDVDKATSYAIYRDTSYISSITSLSPINITSNSFYTDLLNTNGIYYYGIVATDGFVNSNVSNCENVTILIPLTQPTLDLISPNPDYDGIINLNWDSINGATMYYIYRNNSYINSINQLTPVNTTVDNNYTEKLNVNGTYYYVIVAGDGFVNSSISNCVNVTVNLSLDNPNLIILSPNPTPTGNVVLDWDDIEGATTYYIYRDVFFISSIDSLFPITATSISNYTENFYENEIYYYVIVASNGVVDSPISNCIEVTIGRPLETPNLFQINNYGDGTVELFWDPVENATFYYIFRDNITITSINHLNPISIEPPGVDSFVDALYQTGEFFYVVVATDEIVNSSLSNCMSVYVEYNEDLPGARIPGYNLYFIILLISLISIVAFYQKLKKSK